MHVRITISWKRTRHQHKCQLKCYANMVSDERWEMFVYHDIWSYRSKFTVLRATFAKIIAQTEWTKSFSFTHFNKVNRWNDPSPVYITVYICLILKCRSLWWTLAWIRGGKMENTANGKSKKRHWNGDKCSSFDKGFKFPHFSLEPSTKVFRWIRCAPLKESIPLILLFFLHSN